MLKLLGRKTSGNVQKVVWLLEELGAQYEREDYGRQFGNTETPDYLRLNPNAKVPTLVDGDVVIWESNTILRYLANKAGGRFYADDAAGRCVIERWMDWQLSLLVPAMAPLFRGWARTPPAERDVAALEKHRQAAVPHWTVLDQQLAGRQWVGGGEFTIGDIPPGVWIHRWYLMPIERPDLPHLRAWYERLLARPAYRKHVALPLG